MRKWVCFLAAVAFMMAVESMSVFAGGQSESKSGSAAASTKEVTLSWFMWTGSQAEVEAWKALAADVTKKYPYIHVNFDTDSWTGYWNKLGVEIASGTTQDILSLQSLRTTGYGSAFASLDNYIKNDPSINISDFSNAILPNLAYDGHQIALPYDFGPYIIYYNKALFDKYNVAYPKVGWTMTNFLNDLKSLSQGNDYGFVFSSVIDMWLPFVLSNGGSYLDSNGQFDLTGPKTVQAIQEIANLIKNHEALPMVATTDSNWSQEQWLAGNVAMHVNGPWQIINFRNTAKFPFGIATNPVGADGSKTVTAGSGFGISKTTKYPEDAFKAVSVITDPASLKTLALAGRAFPARESVQHFYYQAQGVDPAFKPILDYGVAHSVPYRITTTWAQANDLIFKSMIPIFNGQVPVEQGLAELQSRLNNLQ